MRSSSTWPAWPLAVLLVSSCSLLGPSQPVALDPGPTQPALATHAAKPSAALATPTAPALSSSEAHRALLFDTDVAPDDLVALAFLVSSPQVDLVAITVSGTGEAHCAGGVDIVLRLLERLGAPDIPVACGRETPLAGTHAFPDAWREHVDAGSGLDLPGTDRHQSTSTAVDLIRQLSAEHADLHVLATGPLTNLADALLAEFDLAGRLGPVFIMGGALHVPGNLVCCGAPEGNSVAEWNVFVDPHAAQVVVDSGVGPAFVPLDGTNQVPLTPEFARRAMEGAASVGRKVMADLFTANPYMTDGSFFLWDALAAQMAAGYPVGSFSPASIVVEEEEGPESGFTRPTDGAPNIEYLSSADAEAARATLLAILNGD
jgi:inosine-uridine nucleoside N-ribohydrolase